MASAAVCLALMTSRGVAGERVVLAQGGRAQAAVVVAKDACPASQHAAETLRDMLARISGAAFVIERGDGTAGIAVGTAGEFPALADDAALKLTERFSATDLATRQSYVLRSHAKGVQLVGASELGVVYAGWDLLYRLGYRQFFLGPEWEIVPRTPEVAVTVDTFEKPDFIVRHIAGSVTPDWCLRNRTSPVLGWQEAKALPYLPGWWTSNLVQAYHNWGAIIEHSRAEFEAHPEYLGLVTVEVPVDAPAVPDAEKADLDLLIKGADQPAPALDAKPVEKKPATKQEQKRASSKLCVSNPRVRELAAAYALDYFRKNPQAPSISMEPTDGSGWCECAECAKIGPPAERVALLVNAVAAALEKEFPEKYIGILAYHLHADPPKQRLHPRVAVSLATALSGSTPLDERLSNWAKVSENLGVYEYLSVMEWHIGLPAKSLVANLPHLAKQIPYYQEKHVRFFTGQATGGAWGSQGLGYIVLSRLLWHTAEASRVQAIVDDFLTKAFAEAAEPMRAYYHVVDASQAKPGTAEFFLERSKLMYAALRAARQASARPEVRERIDRLVLYTRYVELYARSGMAKGGDKWPALCRFVRHACRMRDKGMVGFGVVTGYVDNAAKVELRPKPPPPKETELDEAKPYVHEVDRPFAEAEILAFLEGKAIAEAPEDTAPAVQEPELKAR